MKCFWKFQRQLPYIGFSHIFFKINLRILTEIGGCEHPVAIPVGGNDDCACAVVCGWLNTSGAFAHSLSKMDLEADGGAETLSSGRGSDFQHPSEVQKNVYFAQNCNKNNLYFRPYTSPPPRERGAAES